MHALVKHSHAPRDVSVMSRPRPRPGQGQVLVCTEAVGLPRRTISSGGRRLWAQAVT